MTAANICNGCSVYNMSASSAYNIYIVAKNTIATTSATHACRINNICHGKVYYSFADMYDLVRYVFRVLANALFVNDPLESMRLAGIDKSTLLARRRGMRRVALLLACGDGCRRRVAILHVQRHSDM